MSLFPTTGGDVGSDHPSIELLNAFAVGQLAEETSREVELHVTACTRCGQTLQSSPDDSFVRLVQQSDALLREQPLPAVAPARALRFVPGYTLLERLGQGGMGVVYKARQDGLNRVVALKRLSCTDAPSAEALARFRREAGAVARLRHPNIVQIYEVGEQDGEPYLALEYVGGGSLTHKLAAELLPPPVAAALVETLARAMQHAHEHGIIHRDLKPDNILLADDGTLKISDFGLAKLLGEASAHTQTGAILGTPSYMAPEQAGGEAASVSPPTDVYALGAILYETLTGRPPFLGTSVLDTLAQVRDRDPVPPRHLQPSISRDLQTICLKCLHKDPRRRYGSALALADDLRRFAAGEPIQARPVGRLERVLKWMRRRPAQTLLAAVILLGPLLVIAGLLWHNERLRGEIARADAAERSAEDNYRRSRQALLDILARVENGGISPNRDGRQLTEEIARDALQYVEAVLHDDGKNDPHVREDAAALLLEIGRMQFYSGQRDPAHTSFSRALALMEQLRREQPAASFNLGQLVHCCRCMSFVSDADEQLAYRDKVVQLSEELARLHPDDDFETPLGLAQCHHDLAATLQEADRLSEAEPHYDRAVALMTKVAAHYPEHPGVKLGLGDSYGNLGDLYHRTGRRKLAARSFERADTLLAQAIEALADPSGALVSRADVALNWGNFYIAKNQHDKAVACFDRGIACSEAVLKKDRVFPGAQEKALKLHVMRAQTCDALHRHAEAAADWQRVVALANGPIRREYHLRWCISLARAGDSARAAAKAAALAAEPGCPPDMRYNLACVFALAGQGDRAVALLRRLRQDGYFDKAECRDSLLTDPDLDSLRKRKDFTQLTRGLTGKL